MGENGWVTDTTGSGRDYRMIRATDGMVARYSWQAHGHEQGGPYATVALYWRGDILARRAYGVTMRPDLCAAIDREFPDRAPVVSPFVFPAYLYAPAEGWSPVECYGRGVRKRRRISDGLTVGWNVGWASQNASQNAQPGRFSVLFADADQVFSPASATDETVCAWADRKRPVTVLGGSGFITFACSRSPQRPPFPYFARLREDWHDGPLQRGARVVVAAYGHSGDTVYCIDIAPNPPRAMTLPDSVLEPM